MELGAYRELMRIEILRGICYCKNVFLLCCVSFLPRKHTQQTNNNRDQTIQITYINLDPNLIT